MEVKVQIQSLQRAVPQFYGAALDFSTPTGFKNLYLHKVLKKVWACDGSTADIRNREPPKQTESHRNIMVSGGRAHPDDILVTAHVIWPFFQFIRVMNKPLPLSTRGSPDVGPESRVRLWNQRVFSEGGVHAREMWTSVLLEMFKESKSLFPWIYFLVLSCSDFSLQLSVSPLVQRAADRCDTSSELCPWFSPDPWMKTNQDNSKTIIRRFLHFIIWSYLTE